MSKSGIEPKWQCSLCDEVHDFEDAAEDCCRPRVIEGYACPICQDLHRTEADALDCCGFDPDAPPAPPSAAELEAAGQQRLLP